MGIPELPTPHSRRPVHMTRRVTKLSKRSSRPALVPVSLAMPLSPERPYLDTMDGTQDPPPQRWTHPQADYPPPETMKHPQGDPNLFVPCSQVTTVMPVCAASPPHLHLGPQAYTQGPLEPSQTQQSLEVASQDTVIAASELDGSRTDKDTPTFVPDSPMPTSSAWPISRWGNDVWFGVGENNMHCAHTDDIFGPIGSYSSLNLGGGEDGAIVW